MSAIAKLCCCCCRKQTVVYEPAPPTEAERQAQGEKQPLLADKPPIPPSGAASETKPPTPPAGGSVEAKSPTSSGGGPVETKPSTSPSGGSVETKPLTSPSGGPVETKPPTPPSGGSVETKTTPETSGVQSEAAASKEETIVPVEIQPEKSKKPTAKGDWQQELYHKLLETGTIKRAAVIDQDGTVRLANFAVNQKAVKGILQAFKGDTSSIAEDGIKISEELPVYVPGKMDAGKAIYSTAVSKEDELSSPGGCIILKSEKTVVVATYEEDVAAATRLANEVMDRIRELGY